MNPFGRYTHQPQLVESLFVAGVAANALRRREWRTGPRAVAAVAALGWGAIGVIDYAVYAWGYQFFKWVHDDVEEIQSTLAWVRLPIALVATFAVAVLISRSIASGRAGP